MPKSYLISECRLCRAVFAEPWEGKEPKRRPLDNPEDLIFFHPCANATGPAGFADALGVTKSEDDLTNVTALHQHLEKLRSCSKQP